ncbi:2,3-dihydro-2,3-dihydroxybenzoate dehydrogenase [Pseudoalteromonas sp. McH1-7]|uniref:2,3-dihydro-2,3-dihydroxybenzoate dehydrogenase n=1 Tax=Pseudoalteromonas sp. McH1-7 TaxID=2745574 RepID=UPI0015923AF4|nr:2,3-dihydro-2,3-dihydroxybenzoate dehydrogenase [Pseudoalteromonas sp. McH1-7]NUZ11429.1 2,3-dihydro-2,3-dihydroxybenzoate dehydrogenase [Pseudoalteromonas sp. McH1-7]
MGFDSLLQQEYRNKVVWITGAGQGIGQSIAEKFIQLGARVVGFDKQFPRTHNLFKAVQCDLEDLTTLQATLTELIQQGLAPHNLLNVAGVLELGELESHSLEQWQHCQHVNAGAVFVFLKTCASHFKQQGLGSIVTVSSNASHTPRQSMAAYCASKSAATQLTLTAGLELAPYGIRANVIAPGSTLTPMQTGMWLDDSGADQVIQGFASQYKLGIPLQKLATPEEIANSVLFFASSLSSHTTLQVLTIDGGATL